MKNRKLKLRDFEVKSFVTQMNSETEDTVKGGVTPISSEDARSIVENCYTNLMRCPTVWYCP